VSALNLFAVTAATEGG